MASLVKATSRDEFPTRAVSPTVEAIGGDLGFARQYADLVLVTGDEQAVFGDNQVGLDEIRAALDGQ